MTKIDALDDETIQRLVIDFIKESLKEYIDGSRKDEMIRFSSWDLTNQLLFEEWGIHVRKSGVPEKHRDLFYEVREQSRFAFMQLVEPGKFEMTYKDQQYVFGVFKVSDDRGNYQLRFTRDEKEVAEYKEMMSRLDAFAIKRGFKVPPKEQKQIVKYYADFHPLMQSWNMTSFEYLKKPFLFNEERIALSSHHLQPSEQYDLSTLESYHKLRELAITFRKGDGVESIDLSPLANMENLYWLYIGDVYPGRISDLKRVDLSPLKSVPLVAIILRDLDLEEIDLSVLEGPWLRRIYISGCRVKEWKLPDFSYLTKDDMIDEEDGIILELNLHSKEVNLSNISAPMRYITINGPPIESVKLPKQLAKGFSLWIFDTSLAEIDLSPLSGSTLHYLALEKSNIGSIDLSPLSTCSELEGFKLASLPLTDIDLSPLQSCPSLNRLNLTDLPLTYIDLSPLSTHTEITKLTLSNLGLETIDLTPLQSKKIERLDLHGNPLKELNVTPLLTMRESLYRVEVDEGVVFVDAKGERLPEDIHWKIDSICTACGAENPTLASKCKNCGETQLHRDF
ncbi:MAG: hypothetical protein ACXACG_15190 [Candidatus Thorarchaeota archaeon]|jgi:hypothetical protein